MNTVSQSGIPRQGAPESAAANVSMEVVNDAGRAQALTFGINPATVEVTYHDPVRVAVFNREQLQGWLHAPAMPLVGGELIFIVDQKDRIALILPDVKPWTLAPTFLALIRDRV